MTGLKEMPGSGRIGSYLKEMPGNAEVDPWETDPKGMAGALTARIRAEYETLFEDIAEAYEHRVWVHLGYNSWADYVQREFQSPRWKVGKEQRSEAVTMLRAAGMSLRAIAAATGESKDTVQRELKVSGVSNETPAAEVKGMDGKTYPATKPEQLCIEMPESEPEIVDAELVPEPEPIAPHTHESFCLVCGKPMTEAAQ